MKLKINEFMSFDDIKHIDEFGNEYFEARELQKVFEYTQWRKFEGAIKRAKESYINSNIDVNNHFAASGKMINLAKGAQRNVADYHLSRYACYFIAQNGNPGKEIIVKAQTYF